MPSGDLVSSGGKLSKHTNMKINHNDKHKLSHKKEIKGNVTDSHWSRRELVGWSGKAWELRFRV